jgi:hypothetical protein
MGTLVSILSFKNIGVCKIHKTVKLITYSFINFTNSDVFKTKY